jgi:hypothetical protein
MFFCTSFGNNYFILSRISIFLYNKKDKKDKFAIKKRTYVYTLGNNTTVVNSWNLEF